ncbi:hypothetical protein [Novosphingobium album (ex Hu et al. 2023)]|uniref:DUF4175 family protein n=1 Tax=Novosphingobium album (ex Hu et al. 2023) TaxID=2930093 RepID=A0ABT0AWQ4_9SPHN|nr:hypothetical protein [Novosphingobium album (ex Hu et al. 2023)]MCJ2177250.1 hypothetical protein [Novosphingobium album (ex Hu et al. 2023)]
MNPRTDMDNKISAALEAGSISETDATALESALDSIDSALGTGSSGTSSSKLDPSEMKDRIDSLISDQVDAGTLTEDQAAELQSLFAQGPSGAGGTPPEMAASEDGTEIAGIDGTEGLDGMQGMGGPGGPRGPGGPPPPPPPSSSDDSSDSASSDDSTMSVDDVLASMQAFMDNLRASLASGSTYSASSATTTASSGLIVDQLA